MNQLLLHSIKFFPLEIKYFSTWKIRARENKKHILQSNSFAGYKNRFHELQSEIPGTRTASKFINLITF